MIPFLGLLLVADYLITRQALIRQATRYPAVVPRTRQIATYFLILAASLGCHWLLYYADIYPHYDSQFYQRHGIEDDTPRPIGDDGSAPRATRPQALPQLRVVIQLFVLLLLLLPCER